MEQIAVRKGDFMKPTTRFSLFVFAPLYIAFLTPALLLLPTSVLLTLISVFDTTVAATESVGYGVWVLVPIVMVVALFVIGITLHAPYARGSSHQKLWVGIWAVFSVALFVATWLGTTLVTSIGASDYETGEFLSWTATVAALITLALEPGVGLWLYASSRVLRR
jgi:hypothetical protein